MADAPLGTTTRIGNVVLSILSGEGLDSSAYRRNFRSGAATDFKEFGVLLDLELELTREEAGIVRLTERGWSGRTRGWARR